MPPKSKKIPQVDLILYMVFQKIFEKLAGPDRKIPYNAALKDNYKTKANKLKAITSKQKVRTAADKGKFLDKIRKVQNNPEVGKTSNVSIAETVFNNAVNDGTITEFVQSSIGRDIFTDDFRNTFVGVNTTTEAPLPEPDVIESIPIGPGAELRPATTEQPINPSQIVEKVEEKRTPSTVEDVKQELTPEMLETMKKRKLENKARAKQRKLDRKAQEQRFDKLVKDIPRLKKVREQIRKEIKKIKDDKREGKNKVKTSGLNLDSKNIDIIVDAIPESTRPIVSPFVRSLLGGDELSLSSLGFAILGLGMVYSGVSPQATATALTVVSRISDFFNINLGSVLSSLEDSEEEPTIKVKKSKKTKKTKKTKKEKKELITQEGVDLSEQLVLATTREERRLANQDTPIRSQIRRLSETEGKLSELSKEQQKKLITATTSQVNNIINDSERISRNVAISYLNRLPNFLLIEMLRDYDLIPTIPGFIETIENIYNRVRNIEIPRPNLGLPKPDKKIEALLPTRSQVELPTQIGAGVGIASSALSNMFETGMGPQPAISAQEAIRDIAPAAVAAGGAAYLSVAALRRYYQQIGQDPDSPQLSRRIKYLASVPASVVAGILGYKKKLPELIPGEPTEKGITVRKVDVEPEVLETTLARLDQQEKKKKLWYPKSIQASTEILDRSQQEKFSDDLEFAMWNYNPVSSEGGYGTVATNPLKASQALNKDIRFTDAGVLIPYITFNKINGPNMNDKELKELFLGQAPLVEIPKLDFINNKETFENVADFQFFANNDNTSIEILSPYDDFSDVRNLPDININSQLFTVNP